MKTRDSQKPFDQREVRFDALQPEHAFALALIVIQEQVKGLCKEDRDDLFSVLPDLLGGDDETRRSAGLAVNEILGSAKGKVVVLDLRDESTEPVSSWLAFFSRQLKAAREGVGMTQQQLAAAAGLPQSHISRLENGQHSPSAKTRDVLAKALGKPPSLFDPCADDPVEAEPLKPKETPLKRSTSTPRATNSRGKRRS